MEVIYLLSFLITIVKLLLIICAVATVHEFGHFFVSKLFKVQVNEFAIGFGPKIFQKKIGSTMYSLRCIPLGGYCAIEGEDGNSDSEHSFANILWYKKILILVAGVIMNAILAIVIFLSIAFSYKTATTQITAFTDNSVLEQAGVQVGDTICSINGKKTSILADVINQDVNYGQSVEIEYLHDGELKKVVVNNAVTKIGNIGIAFKTDENSGIVTNEINMVSGGGAAVKAGLKSGDKILKINDVEVNNAADVTSIIRENANNEISLTIDRKGETLTKSVTPAEKENLNLGIKSTRIENTNLKYAICNTISDVSNIIGSYVDLFKGKVGINDMSGIVGIGEVVSKSKGIISFLNLMAMISLAVGVANIMPFPPLDGGKVVIVLFETITRKKVSENVEAIISYIGFGLLILLTLFVTYKDIIRII